MGPTEIMTINLVVCFLQAPLFFEKFASTRKGCLAPWSVSVILVPCYVNHKTLEPSLRIELSLRPYQGRVLPLPLQGLVLVQHKKLGAASESRTRHILVGNEAFYQLNYGRLMVHRLKNNFQRAVRNHQE